MLSRIDAAVKGVVVTPSDSVDLLAATRAVYVGTGGDLKVMMADDSAAIIIPSVPSGVMLSISVTRIYSTGTTASGIVAFR